MSHWITKTTEQNKAVVNDFFAALETQEFDMLLEIFAPHARQLNPYAPPGFPKMFEGAKVIHKQYASLVENFGAMKFSRRILATEDPDFILAIFQGEIEIKTGGKYTNDYLGTFQMENGLIVEYTEYFNQITMAKAFSINLSANND